MNRIMPTLDHAFDAVRTALIRQFSTATEEFEGLGPFEAMVAVVLDRSLGGGRWRAALDGLGDDDLLDPSRLANAEIPEITDAVRERGVAATAKAIAPLKRLGRWVADHPGAVGVPGAEADTGTRAVSLSWLREELAAIKGIGPAAADAIVLFALKRPSYPVDRASFRVLVRHGWLDATTTYDEARDFVIERAKSAFGDEEQAAVTALADLSHGMERLGRQFCRAAEARCGGCPLEHLLPEGGPREVDG
jgi:endonuclease III related protein